MPRLDRTADAVLYESVLCRVRTPRPAPLRIWDNGLFESRMLGLHWLFIMAAIAEKEIVNSALFFIKMRDAAN